MVAFLTISGLYDATLQLICMGSLCETTALISKSGFQMDICMKPATCLCKMKLQIKPGVCLVAPLLYCVLFCYFRGKEARLTELLYFVL